MKETTRVTGLFTDLYNGDPWLDVTILGTLKNINFSMAQFRVSPDRNSVWEIINHMISWRENVLQRVQGKVVITPGHNYFEPVQDQSEQAWGQTVLKFENTQKQWISFLKDFNEDDFDKTSAVNNVSHYKHIHGIMQHDAYHLGQLVLLSKLATEKIK